jgi:uncharacterized protein
MKIVDANILLYAVDDGSAHHDRVVKWWEAALSGEEPIGLTWTTLIAFLRLSTQPRVFSRPLSVLDAVSYVDEWLAQPVVKLVAESAEHWRHLKVILDQLGTAGNLTNDAHLASTAVALGATVVSCDGDFSRFRQLRWENPLS